MVCNRILFSPVRILAMDRVLFFSYDIFILFFLCKAPPEFFFVYTELVMPYIKGVRSLCPFLTFNSCIFVI